MNKNAKIIVITAVYFLAAKFGLSLAFSTEQVTTIWPPTGITLAVLLIWGVRFWPGIFLGAFAANLVTNEPILTAAGIAATNTATGLFGVYLLEKLGFDKNLPRIKDVLILVLAAGMFSILISSVFGVLNLTLSNIVAWEKFIRTWLTWWVGDLMGVLLVAPIIFVWTNKSLVDFIKRRWMEAVAFFVLLSLVLFYIFLPHKPQAAPTAYLVLPFIVWAGLRLRQIGAASANFLIAIIAAWATISGHGPFTASDSVESNLIVLMVYIFVFGLTALLMAATIEERETVQKNLRFQYYHDSLTELGNRLQFKEQIESAISKGQKEKFSFSVIKIDFDRFKNLVDSFGYEKTDWVLKEAALRLRMLKKEDETLARLGGDSFGVISQEMEDRDEAIVLANKIFESFRQPFLIQGQEVYLNLSIGICTYPNDGSDASTLLKNAQAALHRAKDLGGNKYQFYYTTLNAEALNQLTLESDLRRAFDRNELEIFFQPQIDLASGRIVKNEALIRWQKPSGELIEASQFIHSAESMGMIGEIEWLSLQQGVAQTADWHKQGFKVGIAVNISPTRFLHDGLPESVEQLLKEFQLPPKYLELEITERILLENSALVKDILDKLKKLDIAVAVDDFNTGYSSLNYIKQFPFDVLKIDRSFISGIPNNTQDCAIAKSIIDLAHSLGKKVCAEGIENQNQLKFLIKNRCDFGQGYLFSQPFPGDDGLIFSETKSSFLHDLVTAYKFA